MNDKPKPLSDLELLGLFESRGMDISGVLPEKLQHINYYRLKMFARPFAEVISEECEDSISYKGTRLTDIISRYYQDKNLRIHLMHAIEKIEVSLKTNLSRILGQKYGAFGYLNFNRWANRKLYSSFNIEEKQYRIKTNLKKALKRSEDIDISKGCNLDEDQFPTVWLGVDLLTFGDVVSMIELLNDKSLRDLSKVYNVSSEEMLSWLSCLQFIRNVCAHNGNLIDIKLHTKPKYRKDWERILYQNIGKNGVSKTPTNKLALVICIVFTLVNAINPKYKFHLIAKCIKNLCKDERFANLLGFNSLKSAQSIVSELTSKSTQ